MYYSFLVVVVVVDDDIETGNRSTNSTVGRDGIEERQDRGHCFFYRVTTINMSRKWIEQAEWAASLCTANSPFPGHVYCSHPVSQREVFINDMGHPVLRVLAMKCIVQLSRIISPLSS